MKAISFMGKGNYQEVTYVWRTGQQEHTHRTYLFPEAVARIFKPEKLFLLVTPEVQDDANFAALKARLGDLLQPVSIPAGRSEAELWQIFDQCVTTVAEGDELLLDVTHAFRSLPLVVFTVAAYLRRTKRVTIRHIVYGAYEAREPSDDPQDPLARAPIFDLTPLVDLLDWLSGAEALLSRSDALLLAEKLEATQQQLRTKQGQAHFPTHLKRVASRLRDLSLSLHLAWPRDVMRTAHDLLPVLDAALEEIKLYCPPFALVVEQVRDEVSRWAYDRPDDLSIGNLKKQLALIQHYLDRGLLVQAITLMREWLVSWVVLKRAQSDRWLSREEREEAAEALNAYNLRLRGSSQQVPAWFEEIEGHEQAADLWSKLAELRNAIAHCGMSETVPSPKNIKVRMEAISAQLSGLLEGMTNKVLRGRTRVIDLKQIYGDVAKLDDLESYIQQAKDLAGEGNDVVLTGQAPIWLYLAISHALHGTARRLVYTSPVTGDVLIFDHSAR